MTERIPWTSQNQDDVLELYLRDGTLDDTDERVIQMGHSQGRTPSSIAYKLGNYRFLDSEAERQGKEGLKGVSKADIQAWKKLSPRPLSQRAIDLIGEKNWNALLEGTIEANKSEEVSMERFVTANHVTQTLEKFPILRSLLTKPFVILTGGSGSGKTKLAESIAEFFRNRSDPKNSSNYSVVAIGSDWTDNRNVLGFVNHLSPNGKLVFQSTPVLDLLLEATKPENGDYPFFLILDEMNLSHVERYFSDFLSVMEQREGMISLHSEGPRNEEFTIPRFEGDDTGVPRKLRYPKNLFVVGTVNVDETTYMFSPKVLDRANVIEFTVESKAIDEFLKGPSEYPVTEMAPSGVPESFLSLALQARNGELVALPESVGSQIRIHLVNLFKIMKRSRFEFAYRTANEVSRYLRVCRHLADDKSAWDDGDWVADLDAQIVQKILPKLHGSVGRVGRLLAALGVYCGGGSMDKAMAFFPVEGTGAPILQNALSNVIEKAHPEFPESRKKLCSMIEVLLEEQFVSFIN